MNATRSTSVVTRAKEAWKKMGEKTAFLRQTSVAAYSHMTPDNIIYWLLPLLVIVTAFIGLFVAQVANCTFSIPFDQFLFGLKPSDRILG
jgi:hypothetical protein